MSKIKNGALDQYHAGPFEQQQFGTAGDEGVKVVFTGIYINSVYRDMTPNSYTLLSSTLL